MSNGCDRVGLKGMGETHIHVVLDHLYRCHYVDKWPCRSLYLISTIESRVGSTAYTNGVHLLHGFLD